MANGGKLMGALVATALWLPAMEGAIAAGRLEISPPTQSTPGEPWLLPDLAPEAAPLNTEPFLTQLAFHSDPNQTLDQADPRFTEASRLFDLGVQQLNRSQYREAILSFEQALEIFREIEYRQGQGAVLGSLGIAYRNLRDYRQAIDFHEQQLAIAREVSDQRGEGNALGNLGLAYASQEDYRQAIDFYEQRLALAREIDDQRGEGNALSGLGRAHHNLGDYRRAIDSHEQHLAIAREIDDRSGEGNALSGLGNAYQSLGDYRRAIDSHEQRLVIAREMSDQGGEGAALNNLGNAYDSLGNHRQAIDFFEQSLATLREIGDQRGEGAALGNLGNAYDSLGNHRQAIDFYEQSLAILREIGDRSGEGAALNNLGIAYDSLGDTEPALDFYRQSLAIRQDIGDRAGEGRILNNIGILLNDQDQPELAIIFLKASVDVREAIRGDLRGLDTDLQQSFTDRVASSYRLLADLLLQADRVLEAQRVLDLLKVQELDDYLQGVQRNARTASGIDYLRPEQSILDQYNQLQASAIALGQERAQLSQRQSSGDLTPAETQRLQELVRLEQALAVQFNGFAEAPEIQTLLADLSPRVLRQTVDLEGLSALRNNLDSLDAALIYPLILEDRLELVITTADTEPLRRTVAVGRTELNAAITAFRQALEDPGSDAQTLAQQLYRWLVEPLEVDLAAAGVTTLLYAPDAALRYIPLAALHDGDQWLAERFRINHITALSLEELTAPPQAAPRILAGAFADVGTVHPVRSFALQGLPYAGEEVSLLQAALPNTVALIDQDFDLDTVLLELGSANILHFATHGVFVPGEPEDSFILFGNGDAPTLRDIGSWSLSHIDLVVLSACETGLGGFDNDGEQILGLGYQFQRRGAKAVIASLWAVSDQGTQVLMTAFYGGLQQGMTKTEALQAAQTALITNDFEAVGGQRGTVELVSTTTGRPLVPGGTLAHPYYWAPFILIGNGL
jgi:CHAT domain-containing protein/Tfp pilus assembly protein PilF